MKLSLFYSFCFILSMSSDLSAYIYRETVLKKCSSQGGNCVFVHGLGDFHDKCDDSGASQREELDKLFEKAEKDTVSLFVEDLSSEGIDGRSSCGKFHVNSRGGLLGGLAQDCKKQGVDVHNLEYRFCRVAALGPVLNNIEAKPETLSSVKGITVSALSTEIDAVMKEISSYDDQAPLNAIYKKEIAVIKKKLSRLCDKGEGQLSVASYLEKKTTPSNRLDFLKNWLTFDSGLLDLRLVHAIVNARGKKNIVVIAGGSHIDRINQLLKKVGYVTESDTQVMYGKETDLKRCLGSNIVNGSYCVRPQPIKLNAVHNMFKS